jgi:xanthine dehydrogenase accessory factor
VLPSEIWNPEVKSMRELVRHLINALEQERELIVCQVVETRGSTPQKAGSMMIVDPDGGQVGTLGGGCVENEVKQKAIQQIGGDSAAVHSFVLDHDYAWADGLICGGKMVILTQPLRGTSALHYFRTFDIVIEQCRGFTEAIVVERKQAGGALQGTRFLFDGESRPRASWPAAPVPEGLVERIIVPTDRPKPSVHDGIAFLPTWPRIRLIIVGAGHVGQAVAGLAAGADFDVWVVDDRHQYANRERFPAAQKVLVGPIEEVLASLEITPQTFALIVTRGHGHDQEALFQLAPTAASYVGLIGSRRKIRLIFESLSEAGVSASDLDRVAAPVGLDIGSQSVPEIAISIVAELIARRNLGRQGAPAGPRGESGGSATRAGTRAGAGVASEP